MSTVVSIVQKWLAENGYDGLYSPLNACGCELSDLMPCDQPGTDCQAGHKMPCSDDCEVGGECDWHIGARR